jgi:hypothetical protein
MRTGIMRAYLPELELLDHADGHYESVILISLFVTSASEIRKSARNLKTNPLQPVESTVQLRHTA